MIKIFTLIALLLILIGCDGESTSSTNKTLSQSFSSMQESYSSSLSSSESSSLSSTGSVSSESSSQSSVAAKESEEESFYGEWRIIGIEGYEAFFSHVILYTRDTSYCLGDYGYGECRYDKFYSARRVSKEIVEFTGSRQNYYAVKAGISNISARGSIQTLRTNNLRDYSLPGSMEMSFNSNVGDETYTVVSDDNGDFKVDNIPSGEYDIEIHTPSDTISATLNLDEESNDMGVFTDVENVVEYNFKAELIVEDQFIYGDKRDHSAIIRVHNIGKERVKGVSFNISVNKESTHLSEFSFRNELGSIEPGKSKDLRIYFKPDRLSKERDKIIFDINIQDIYHNSWYDKVSNVIYRDSLKIYSDQLPMGGVMMISELGAFDFSYYEFHEYPYLKDADYTIFLHTDLIEKESAYSIGIENSDVSARGFSDTGAFEPNDSVEEATVIHTGEVINSYLHVDDFDVYKIVL